MAKRSPKRRTQIGRRKSEKSIVKMKTLRFSVRDVVRISAFAKRRGVKFAPWAQSTIMGEITADEAALQG